MWTWEYLKFSPAVIANERQWVLFSLFFFLVGWFWGMCVIFCFFCYYFFPFFLIPFSAHQGSRQPAKRDARSIPTAMPLAGRGPRAAFIPKMPLKPIEARTGAVFLLLSPPFPFPPLRASPARPGKSHSATQQGWPQAQVTAWGVL